MINWKYSKASCLQMGLMTCRKCGHKINSPSKYRHFFDGKEHVTEHEYCSKDDPMWKKIDFEKEEREAAELIAKLYESELDE